MSNIEISNFRPDGDHPERLNALFDLLLPDGTVIHDAGVSDDGTYIELSGIDNETPWRDAILSAVEIKMNRHRRDVQQAKDVTRLVPPRPRGT